MLGLMEMELPKGLMSLFVLPEGDLADFSMN